MLTDHVSYLCQMLRLPFFPLCDDRLPCGPRNMATVSRVKDDESKLPISSADVISLPLDNIHSVRWAGAGAGDWSGVREKYYWLASGWKLVLERCERKTLSPLHLFQKPLAPVHSPFTSAGLSNLIPTPKVIITAFHGSSYCSMRELNSTPLWHRPLWHAGKEWPLSLSA